MSASWPRGVTWLVFLGLVSAVLARAAPRRCPVLAPFFCEFRNGTAGAGDTIRLWRYRSPFPPSGQNRNSLAYRRSASRGARRGAVFPRFLPADLRVERLKLIYADLRRIPPAAFANLAVTDIDLQGNQLKDNIAGQAFEGVATTLRRLSLAWCAITQLNEALFRGMFSLEVLYLEENAIRSIPNKLFQDLRDLRHISLAGNRFYDGLPVDVFRYQANLETLDIGYCHLAVIQWNLFSGLWNLKTLDLRGNYIRELPMQVFYDLNSLDTLKLSHNAIRQLQSKVLVGLYNLRVFEMEECRLTDIDADVFMATKHLRELDLSNNGIARFEPGVLLIASLHRVHLDGNRLRAVPPDIAYLFALRELDLSYNHIARIDICEFSNIMNLTSLNLRENPFVCDCDLFWLRKLRTTLMRRWHPSRPQPFVPGKCASPPLLKGIVMTNWLDIRCFSHVYHDTESCEGG